MAKDYAAAKKKTESPNDAKSLSQTLAMWLSTILLIFLFALGLFFLSHQDKLNDKKQTSALVKKGSKHKKRIQIVQKAKSNKPKFEFYNILTKDKHAAEAKSTQAKAEVTNHLLESSASKAAAKKIAPVKEVKPVVSNDSFATLYLQVASFRQSDDAETLRARLSLAGYAVKIQKTFIKDFYWYRVFVGPYQKRADAEAAQVTLRKYKLNSLIRKL